jgi:uncharacterized protein (DUF1697 family)
MTYVALLRGINVGGQRKVEMSRLKKTFERAGADDVRTYINSGNVLFEDDRRIADLVPALEEAIEDEFGFHVKVLLRDKESIAAVVEAIPDSWVNDKTERTDVWFLWEDYDSPDVIAELTIKEGIDEVFYVDGAVVWRADGAQLTRSGRGRVIGSTLYKHLTSRNVNTLRKIHQLMSETVDE